MTKDMDSSFAARCLTDAYFPELPGFYRGKVRDTYRMPDNRQVMIATDRQSAFDQVLTAVPYKGQVLNQTARFWFEATADICPNHVISYPDPNVVIARHLTMLPIEMIVRDLGHDVVAVATTHREAVAEAQKHQPGLVLADIQLADNSSGIEAVQEILSEVKLPVIFITAFPERLLTGDRPEPAFLLTKPYQPATLRAAISQVLFFDESTVPA